MTDDARQKPSQEQLAEALRSAVRDYNVAATLAVQAGLKVESRIMEQTLMGVGVVPGLEIVISRPV